MWNKIKKALAAMMRADKAKPQHESDAKLKSDIAHELARQATYGASIELSGTLRAKPKGERLSASELKRVETFLEADNWLPALTAAWMLQSTQQFDEAERILLLACDATERDAAKNDWCVAPGVYERLAKLYRKQKRYEAEVSILERLERQMPGFGAGPNYLSERLEKAKALRAKTAGQ
jgi:hypothetical protein